jgi:agmatine deiminase
VALNDYQFADREYGREIRRRLKTAGLNVITIPYRPGQETLHSIPSAFGNYVNFLHIGSLIVLPSFNIVEDAQARNIFENEFYGLTANLDCRKLATEGGVLNCCTWTTKQLW